jgi:hypothetical protein
MMGADLELFDNILVILFLSYVSYVEEFVTCEYVCSCCVLNESEAIGNSGHEELSSNTCIHIRISTKYKLIHYKPYSNIQSNIVALLHPYLIMQ